MKQFISSTLIFAFLITSNPVLSATSAAPAKVVLSPSLVRELMLKNNLKIDEQQKQVEDAKTKIAAARTNLFPSLNVTALLSGNFALTAISFLLPFLVPSNWTAFDQSKELFESEKLSYKTLELNTYSSALSVYFNVKADSEIADRFAQQAKDMRDISDSIEHLAALGVASGNDVASARGEAENAEGLAAQQQVAMVQEIASLRQTMGLPLETQIGFSQTQADQVVPASNAESAETPSEISAWVEKALAVAPEKLQIDHLVKAADAGQWGAAFGWINSATLSAGAATGSSGASLSKLQARGTIQLGLGIFPELELSERNVEEVKETYLDLKSADTQLLEGSILAVRHAKDEYDDFTQSENDFQAAYDSTQKLYQMGITSIYDVLTAHKSLTAASISRIQAELSLNLLRVALHRTLLTYEFANIHGCDGVNLPEQKKEGGLGGWLKGLFGGKTDQGNSLLQLCKP